MFLEKFSVGSDIDTREPVGDIPEMNIALCMKSRQVINDLGMFGLFENENTPRRSNGVDNKIRLLQLDPFFCFGVPDLFCSRKDAASDLTFHLGAFFILHQGPMVAVAVVEDCISGQEITPHLSQTPACLGR